MNITIVGGGQGGYGIARYFSILEGFKVNLIIDKREDAPAIVYAKKMKIPYASSIDRIDTSSTDIIIEVTGNDEFSKLIHDKYCSTCTVINSGAAHLITTLVQKDAETLAKLNTEMKLIGDASELIKQQINEINLSIDNIHNVSDKLALSTSNSSNYINSSHEIIDYVEKMSKQTRILGINASIQAARAGEHGKGFSVVSTEIQKLAESTKNFGNEISSMLSKLMEEIKDISKETNSLKTLSNVQIHASEKVTQAVDGLLLELQK